jgi:hypothetical protein
VKPAIAKAVQPSAPLEIDGETYHLVFNYNAIAEAEIATGFGCNLLHGISAPSTITALQLRGLLFAALTPLQPKTTMKEAGSLIRLDTIPAVLQAIGESWTLSIPEAKRNPPAAADPPDGE